MEQFEMRHQFQEPSGDRLIMVTRDRLTSAIYVCASSPGADLKWNELPPDRAIYLMGGEIARLAAEVGDLKLDAKILTDRIAAPALSMHQESATWNRGWDEGFKSGRETEILHCSRRRREEREEIAKLKGDLRDLEAVRDAWIRAAADAEDRRRDIEAQLCHETVWLKSLLAEERARADRAEKRATKPSFDQWPPPVRRQRLEAAEESAAVRLQEILRLRREREGILARGWTDEILAETLVVRPSPFLFRNAGCPTGAPPDDAEPKLGEQLKPEATTAPRIDPWTDALGGTREAAPSPDLGGLPAVSALSALINAALGARDLDRRRIVCCVEASLGGEEFSLRIGYTGSRAIFRSIVSIDDPPSLIRLRAEGLVKELREAIDRKGERRLAPWPDFAGNQIHEGDTIRHPDGPTGIVVYDESLDPPIRWRVRYPNDDCTYWFGSRVGDQGMAVVAPEIESAE